MPSAAAVETAAPSSQPRSPFVRSDLGIAVAGALLMAVAGAGMASWFGPGDMGAAQADSYTTTVAQN